MLVNKIKKTIKSDGAVESLSRGMNWLLLVILPFCIDINSYGEVVQIVVVLLVITSLSLFGQDRAALRYTTANSSNRTFHYIIGIIACLFLSPGICYLFNLDVIIFSLITTASMLLVIYRIECAILRKVPNGVGFRLLRLTYTSLRLFFGVFFLSFMPEAKTIIIVEIVALVSSFLIYILSKSKSKSKSKSNLDIKHNKSVLKLTFFGGPIFIHVAASLILSSSDKLIIANSLSHAELANYNFIYSIASSLIFIFAILSVIYEPKVYKMETLEEAKLVVNKYKRISIAVGGLFSILLFLLYYISIEYFISNYDFLPMVFILILLGHLIYPLYLSKNYLLVYNQNTKNIAFSSLLAAPIVYGFNYFLIPVYGLLAAAISTFIGYLLLVVFINIFGNTNEKKESCN